MVHSRKLILSAVIALGAIGGVAAASDTTSPATSIHRMYGYGLGMHSPFLRAVRQLELSDDQKQRIRSLVTTEREAARANGHARRAELSALANPGDPNYASAVAAAKAAAANAIQRRSDLDVQVYGVLTPDQQAQLPKILADMRTRMEQHRLQRLEQGSSKTTPG